jgi:hypothetical protein
MGAILKVWAWAGFKGRAEVRLGGRIPIQDKVISGEAKPRSKLGSDPQAALTSVIRLSLSIFLAAIKKIAD